jgi:hypothetical protein
MEPYRKRLTNKEINIPYKEEQPLIATVSKNEDRVRVIDIEDRR